MLPPPEGRRPAANPRRALLGDPRVRPTARGDTNRLPRRPAPEPMAAGGAELPGQRVTPTAPTSLPPPPQNPNSNPPKTGRSPVKPPAPAALVCLVVCFSFPEITTPGTDAGYQGTFTRPLGGSTGAAPGVPRLTAQQGPTRRDRRGGTHRSLPTAQDAGALYFVQPAPGGDAGPRLSLHMPLDCYSRLLYLNY